MPEGHAVHRHARALTRSFAGEGVAVSSPQGRFAPGAALLDGATLVEAEAYGKHLFARFAPSRGPEQTLHVHLGLYGKWTFGTAAPEPRGQVRLRLLADRAYADLRGPTACEVLAADEVAAIVQRIGPDPIRRDADPERAWARVRRSRAPIATLLMDQSVFAGVGNIYRAEVLFRAGIDPYRPACEVARLQFDDLWADLVVLMKAGLRSGRIVTTEKDDRWVGSTYVYRRQGEDCVRCGDEVAWSDIAGRTLYWCPGCQAA